MLKKLNKYFPYFILIILFIWHSILFAQERFPRPEFESGYTFPSNQLLNQRGPVWEYVDVAVLIATLLVTSWLALKRRSRQGLLWTSIFTLAYFGFYRQGCICSVGSIQNVALSLFNSGYAIPVTALLFFIIPLVFALLSGRVFCSGVCPLGAIQEVTGFRQVKVPKRIESILTTIPFIYLGLSILFAATGSQFLICRYDPFVGIFRIDAPFAMIIFGSLLLVAGIFVNRPYCRYLCPYGVMLGFFSRFSVKHLSITPAECRVCRLCETVCPYDAILAADKVTKEPEVPVAEGKRKYLYMLLIPVLAIAGAVIFSNLAPSLSVVNKKVSLAKEVRLEKEKGIKAVSKEALAYMESGKSEEELYKEEALVLTRFIKGSPWVGLFLGLSLGIGLYSSMIRERRTEYEPDRGRCVSCGKCFKYCPVKVKA
jgi:NosR/NirI family transcriptional regulator, nitrous oxide reductase regulator